MLVLTFAPLHLVLALAATSGGGVSPSDIGTKTPLAPAVVSPVATCAGGVFPSTHWCRYLPYTLATCGGFLVVVVDVCACGGGGGG